MNKKTKISLKYDIIVTGDFFMQINRSEARYKAMTILYQINLYEKNKINYVVEDVIKEQLEIQNDFVNELVFGVINNKKEIDEVANKYLNNWSIDRLGLTDQAIIEISIYEIMFTDTPNLVCINEAIELAKKYSDEKISKMINGALDRLYHDYEDNK